MDNDSLIKRGFFVSLAFNIFLLISALALLIDLNKLYIKNGELIIINSAVEKIAQQNRKLKNDLEVCNQEKEQKVNDLENRIRAVEASCQLPPSY